jgi:hypothetical protein
MDPGNPLNRFIAAYAFRGIKVFASNNLPFCHGPGQSTAFGGAA